MACVVRFLARLGLLALFASPVASEDLGGLWKVTVAEHRHPSGRMVPARTEVHVFEQFGESLSVHAARAYPDAELHAGTVRGSRVIALTRQDSGVSEFPEFAGTQWRTYLVGSLAPDGRRIEARDQAIGIVRFNTGGQYAARAVRYTIPVSMERLNLELGFVRAGAGTAEFPPRIDAGEEFRLLARFDEPLDVERVDALLSSGGPARKLTLTRDTADPSLFWSERLPTGSDAAPEARAEYLAWLGPAQAAISVDAAAAPVRSFCPRFLHEAIIEDYDDATPHACARPNLPGALRGATAAATARSVVRFERQLRQNATLSWDLPREVRTASTCPPASGRSPDEDAWVRMRTAAEYFVARRRLVDGIMSGLESLASLDAMSAMQCGAGTAGVSSQARLLRDIECARLAHVPGGREACVRLQSQCPDRHSFSALLDETELALRQKEAVGAALAMLGSQSGEEAQRKRAQLQWVQQMTDSMNPWLQGTEFQDAYDSALSTCRANPAAGSGFCDAQRRMFVCEGVKSQAAATATTIKLQIDKFAQALACIESAEGQCELSSRQFRDIVRRAPELRKLFATRAAAPEDRALAGFAEFMVSDIDCRAQMQVVSDEQREAVRDFAIGASLTVATAGLGSVAARVALTASRARAAGLAIDAARAATMATRLQRAALAIDLVDMGFGVANGIAKCDDVFSESSALPPVNVSGPQCPATQRYDGPHLTGHYRSCVLRTVAFSLATAGLVAIPPAVSRLMDDSALRRAAEALQLPDGSRFSAQQRAALLQVFRERLAGSLDEGIEAAEAVLKNAGFDDAQIRALFLKLAPDVRLLGTKLVQGIDGDVIRHVKLGEHTLAITRARGRNQIVSCSFCTVLAKLEAGADLDQRALEDLAALGSRLGLDQRDAPEALVNAFRNIIHAVNGAADPVKALAAAKRVRADVLKNAAGVISSDAFAKAIKARPDRAAAVFDQLARHADQATELLSRLPRADALARDLGDLVDLFAMSDVLPRVARLAGKSEASAVMTVARAAAEFGRTVPRNDAGLYVDRMLRLAEDLADAGPAIGSERRMWAMMSDVAVARERLGSAKFADYLEAIDDFRRADGHAPGVIRNARARETANLQDVISGDLTNPVNNALELVGTKWLIDTGTRIGILAGRSDRGVLQRLPALTKPDVTGFGARQIRTPGTTRTIEADTALSIPASRMGSGTTPMDIVLDWKNYETAGVLKDSDIDKALEALDSGAVSNVLFLSPRPWSPATIERIAQLDRPGLMLGTIAPDDKLLRFLDEPLP